MKAFTTVKPLPRAATEIRTDLPKYIEQQCIKLTTVLKQILDIFFYEVRM